jgi:CheY-like chemotaxis protein
MIDSTFKNANILIVDDMEANIAILVGLLEIHGFTNITTTTDPLSTVSLFKSFKPDLILLDLMMLQLSGYEVMEQLKPLIPAGTYMPILVLTADISPNAKQRALADGAKDFLAKPFDFIEVILRIRNLLETRYLHQQLENQNKLLEEKIAMVLKVMDGWYK